ncbi:MAG: VOC family protein [Bacteroidia bacterium]|nr:VOC family protein [Bacteroidia bacterium]
MSVKKQPDGYQTAIPFLVVKDVDEVLEFTKKVFNAEEIEKITKPDGSVMHAEVRIGDSVVMIGPAHGDKEPITGMIYIYVEDTNATYQKAIDVGATSLMEPADQFYGDRYAGVKDSQGNTWWIATHIEDVSQEEIQKRSVEMPTEQQN